MSDDFDHFMRVLDLMIEFASPKLSVELIPMALWRINVRTKYPDKWPKLRNVCSYTANYQCEICGGHGRCKHYTTDKAESEWNILGDEICAECKPSINYIEV